ncbi:hypothetical protein HK405_015102, partial [Cladochytrium tenue]
TALCKRFWLTGSCPYDQECGFIHMLEEAAAIHSLMGEEDTARSSITTTSAVTPASAQQAPLRRGSEPAANVSATHRAADAQDLATARRSASLPWPQPAPAAAAKNPVAAAVSVISTTTSATPSGSVAISTPVSGSVDDELVHWSPGTPPLLEHSGPSSPTSPIASPVLGSPAAPAPMAVPSLGRPRQPSVDGAVDSHPFFEWLPAESAGGVAAFRYAAGPAGPPSLRPAYDASKCQPQSTHLPQFRYQHPQQQQHRPRHRHHHGYNHNQVNGHENNNNNNNNGYNFSHNALYRGNAGLVMLQQQQQQPPFMQQSAPRFHLPPSMQLAPPTSAPFSDPHHLKPASAWGWDDSHCFCDHDGDGGVEDVDDDALWILEHMGQFRLAESDLAL